MTVEDNVFLLGFIDVYPVDGLGDILKLLLGDGIAAMGETLLGESPPKGSQTSRLTMVTTQVVKILTAVPKL